MKKCIKYLVLAVVVLITMSSCWLVKGDDGVDNINTKVKMIAQILELDNNILVQIKESEYASGNCILNVGSQTKYYNKNGKEIPFSDLQIGDIIQVSYSGQMTLSIPPQVFAYVINIT